MASMQFWLVLLLLLLERVNTSKVGTLPETAALTLKKTPECGPSEPRSKAACSPTWLSQKTIIYDLPGGTLRLRIEPGSPANATAVQNSLHAAGLVLSDILHVEGDGPIVPNPFKWVSADDINVLASSVKSSKSPMTWSLLRTIISSVLDVMNSRSKWWLPEIIIEDHNSYRTGVVMMWASTNASPSETVNDNNIATMRDQKSLIPKRAQSVTLVTTSSPSNSTLRRATPAYQYPIPGTPYILTIITEGSVAHVLLGGLLLRLWHYTDDHISEKGDGPLAPNNDPFVYYPSGPPPGRKATDVLWFMAASAPNTHIKYSDLNIILNGLYRAMPLMNHDFVFTFHVYDSNSKMKFADGWVRKKTLDGAMGIPNATVSSLDTAAPNGCLPEVNLRASESAAYTVPVSLGKRRRRGD